MLGERALVSTMSREPGATCSHCGEALPALATLRFCPSCATPVAAQAGDPLVGTLLADRYRLIAPIGEGGMGRVYLAEQTLGAARRRVAVKILLPELAEEPTLVARFLHEIGVVAQLEHPNTVRVLDAGRTREGLLYIVMELLSGVPLSSLIAAGPVESQQLDRILEIGRAHV